MLHFRLTTLIVLSLCSLTFAQTRGGGERGPNVPDFWVRPGYRVTLAADKLPEARFMEFDDKGTLYLSQPGAGSITTLVDKNKDGNYEILGKFITEKKPSTACAGTTAGSISPRPAPSTAAATPTAMAWPTK